MLRVIPAHKKYVGWAMHLIGITRLVTFQGARYTFATVSLTLGIAAEVLQQLMGHTKLATTMQYAKVVDSVKIESMKKWAAL